MNAVSAGSTEEIEDLATKAVSDAIDEIAISAVAKAVSTVTLQRAMAAAVVRYAASALERLSSPEDAYLTLTRLAGRHQKRMAQRGGRNGRSVL